MTPAPVQPFYDAARNYVKRAVGVELDDSEESLAYVDHYITTTAQAEALKPEVLALVAPALGAYLGQVAIARFGGKWVAEGADPADWRVELDPAPLVVSTRSAWPPRRCAARRSTATTPRSPRARTSWARSSRRSRRRRPSTRPTTTRSPAASRR